MNDLRKHAHDSGDGQTIYHCPFCGSGQVLARSDRTIECQFCHVCFTVQVQPQFPAFPQTINGQPVQVPGMPGQISAPGADLGAGIGGPGTGEDAPIDPTQVDEQGDVQDADSGGDEQDDSGDDAPPWAKQSSLQPSTERMYVTERGHILSEVEYRNHLAIKSASNPRAMAAMIKEARR